MSASLLDFARFRLDRRGEVATYVDLTEQDLEAERYDVITAIDTLAHVPDIAETARRLVRTLRTGGWLFAGVDVRDPGPASAWHLQDDDVRVSLELRRVGFRRRGVLDGPPVYQLGEPPGPAGRARVRAASVVLTNSVSEVARRVRWPTYSKIRRRLQRRARPGGRTP